MLLKDCIVLLIPASLVTKWLFHDMLAILLWLQTRNIENRNDNHTRVE